MPYGLAIIEHTHSIYTRTQLPTLTAIYGALCNNVWHMALYRIAMLKEIIGICRCFFLVALHTHMATVAHVPDAFARDVGADDAPVFASVDRVGHPLAVGGVDVPRLRHCAAHAVGSTGWPRQPPSTP